MKIYLVVINFFLILGGLGLCGIAIWMAVEHKGYGEMISGALVWAPMGVGIGLTLLGLMGCFGTIFENRCLVFMYILVTSILLVLCICAGIFLIIQVNGLEKVATEDPTKITDSTVLDVLAYESAIFNVCCSQYPAVPMCGSSPCYPQSYVYQSYFEQLDPDFCSVLSGLYAVYEGESVPLVGDNGGCGYGDASTFFSVMAAYAHQSLVPGATIILALAMSLLVGMVFGCFMIFLPARKSATYTPPMEEDVELTSLTIN